VPPDAAIESVLRLDVLEPTLDRLPAAMMLVARDGTIAFLNGQAEKLLQYERAALVGKRLESLIPERFRASHPGYRQAFGEDPRARPMGAGRELFALRGDGTEIPVEIGLNPIATDRGPLVLAVIVDITERRRSQRRLAQVVESSPSAMVMVNAGGRIAMVNAQAESLFGYSRAELVGASVDMLVPERFRGGHPALRAGFAGTHTARPMGAGRDLFARRRDGSEFPVEIGLNPIETEEGPMVLSAIVDITERREREEGVRRALKEKELLLGEIHHRVKNNLQVIHSLLDLQASRTTDPAARAMMLDSQNRVRSMALVHHTLYHSHDFARVDFDTLLGTLVPMVRDSFEGSAPVAIEVDPGGIALPIAQAIPCALIANELVTNALKHAFDGQPGTVRVALRHDGADRALMEVANDGRPIPESLDLTDGASLGMTIVSELVAQLRGSLDVRRADPVRFEIRFPLGAA